MASGARAASFAVALLVALAFAASPAVAEQKVYYVGDSVGWTTYPPTDYQAWANAIHFEVNDKLVFKYDNSDECVLQVSKTHFDSCETRRPIRYMCSGTSVVTLQEPGSFYFISGNMRHCTWKGMKMIVQVTPKAPAPTPAIPPSASPSPAPTTPAPHTSTPTPVSSPSTTPSPSPKAASPVQFPPSSSPVQPPTAEPHQIMTPAPAPTHSSASPAASVPASFLLLTSLVALAAFRV